MQAMFTRRTQLLERNMRYADAVEVLVRDGGQVTLRLLASALAFALAIFTRKTSANSSASQLQEKGQLSILALAVAHLNGGFNKSKVYELAHSQDKNSWPLKMGG